MRIGIDGSRAFIKNRTGIEEYAYRVIDEMREILTSEQVFLYIRQEQEVDFVLPKNWKIKKMWFPRLWTQIRLSLEMLINRVDVLFIPAHTVPLIHPKKTIVVVHGLEFEFCGQAYSTWEKMYMRMVIKNSCKWASDIICVSKNTRDDVMQLYGIEKEKITVIYEGYSSGKQNFQFTNYDFQLNYNTKDFNSKTDSRLSLKDCSFGEKIQNYDYVLFIGRIEERKNVTRIAKAFEYIKKKYGITHKLVLVGRPGHGYEEIKNQISKLAYKNDILELGYINEQEKWKLLSCARVFVFPTLYEGFGLPILEAQSAMIPVVASNNSSIPEVAGRGALLVDPQSIEEIGENIYLLLKDERAREKLIRQGYENIKRFSWAGCARDIISLLIN